MRSVGMSGVGLLASLVFALAGCNVQIGIARPGATSISPPSNDPRTQRFVDTVAAGVRLNSGISLQLLGSAIVVGGAPTSGANIAILVLNLSDEPVTFPDQSFGLRAYTFDLKTNAWLQQQFVWHSAPQPKTIPAKVGKYDPAANNVWNLGPKPFGSLNLPEFRLYVEGTGTITAQKYGAFLDVTLSQ
jgi:hypothetical protein